MRDAPGSGGDGTSSKQRGRGKGKEDPLVPAHLIWYACWQRRDLPGAVDFLRKSANAGFPEDWQLLLQAELELAAQAEGVRAAALEAVLAVEGDDPTAGELAVRGLDAEMADDVTAV